MGEIHHRILYPNEDFKAGWEVVPADGKPIWEHIKKVGELSPGAPSLSSYATYITKGEGKGIERFDDYTLLSGETVLKATLYVYGVESEKLQFQFGLLCKGTNEAGGFSKALAESPAWYSCTWTVALTQAQVNELEALVESTDTTSRTTLYAAYIDLETETEGEAAAPGTAPTIVHQRDSAMSTATVQNKAIR